MWSLPIIEQYSAIKKEPGDGSGYSTDKTRKYTASRKSQTQIHVVGLHSMKCLPCVTPGTQTWVFDRGDGEWVLLGDQAFCGDEERAGTTGVTVARYERTQPHRINRFKAAGFMFYFDEKVNRAWRTQKITTRLGRVVDCKLWEGRL